MKIEITEKEAKLLNYFLESLSDKYGNAGCNDLEDSIVEMFSKDEWDEINKQYHTWNGDPEEYNPGQRMFDFSLVYWLQKKIGIK